MRKHLLIPLTLLLAGFTVIAHQDQKPSEYKIPDDAVKMTNPVKPTPESLAHAKKTYGIDCLMCHGADGDGKGDVGADMHLKDYRDADALKDKTDGELFYIIKNGKGEMPSEGDRAKPDEVWGLVNYIRAFAKKNSAPKDKPAPQ
jgi:mono/diheme cytochrome c family protein